MKRTHDLIVIGAGAAGLTAAGGAARLGLHVALIERDRMGGECLNTGCVPSKALIAAARRAHLMRSAPAVGLAAVAPDIDFARVRAHVRAAIAAIAPHDSAERFQSWGVDVIHGQARFLDGRSVEVDGNRLVAPRFVVAVGSRPAIPDVEGLAQAPYLTNETVFDLDALPRHLVVLGGGAVGMELAQAFRRLGAAVTVIEAGRPFPRDDPEAAAVVLERLAAEGVVVRPGTRAIRVAAADEGVRVEVEPGEAVTGSHLLVAVGRAPALEGLGLDAADVQATAGGIGVDERRRTSNRRIYAVGDCREGPRFTHVAGYEGALVVREIALGLPAAANFRALPWVTYTDPELAQVGLTEAAARARHGGRVQVRHQPFSDNDRAVTEGAVAGFVKVVEARGKLVGATLVGAGAGELVLPWSLAIAGKKATPWAISGAIVPYPTRSEISKAVAFSGYEALAFGRPARLWARSLAHIRHRRARGLP
jgi:pyruvate/2-oxoglutarate dehydrogenase complex dihydrolipoamide dehydrogenase (E3) component